MTTVIDLGGVCASSVWACVTALLPHSTAHRNERKTRSSNCRSARPDLSFCSIKPDQIATCAFGLVHCGVHPPEEIFLTAFAVDEHDHANTCVALIFD